MFYPYVHQSNLKHLKEYKYEGLDRSLVAKYIMQPFWNWFVTFLPHFMAPNLVTLVGFTFILLSYCLLAFYSPTLTEDCPRWVYLFTAFSIFFYQTMDAVDGKQARRTKTSSPLGELFDHGCDAITTVLVTIGSAAAMHTGHNWFYFFTCASLLSALFLTIWDLYFTHCFDLGVVNVTEGLLGIVTLHLVAAYDPHFWIRPLPIFNLKYFHIFAAISCFASLNNSFSSIVKVVQHCRSEKATRSLSTAVSFTIPFWTIALGGALWVIISPSGILSRAPHLLIVTLGWLNAYCVGRLMVQRLCKMEPQTFYYVLLVVPIAIVNSLFRIVDELVLLRVIFVISFLAWLHFVVCIIQSFCGFLKINCLSLTEEQKKVVVQELKKQK